MMLKLLMGLTLDWRVTDIDPKDLMTLIAKALVDLPEQISINEIESNSTIIIELKVAKGDLGRIIGKQGRTANAIRPF